MYDNGTFGNDLGDGCFEMAGGGVSCPAPVLPAHQFACSGDKLAVWMPDGTPACIDPVTHAATVADVFNTHATAASGGGLGSLLSGTILGIPTVYVLAAGAALLLFSGKK